MSTTEIPVEEFDSRAAELLRDVEENKQTLVITSGGKPIAVLRPVTNPARDLIGSVTYLDADWSRPVVEADEWEANRDGPSWDAL